MINVGGVFKVVSYEEKGYGKEGKTLREYVLQEYGKPENTIKAISFGSYIFLAEGSVVSVCGTLQIKAYDYKGRTGVSYSIVISGADVLKGDKPIKKETPKPVPKKEATDDDDIPF